MSKYLPAGSDHDIDAPWNQTENLCRYCDVDVIKEIAMSTVDTDRDVEDIEQELLDNAHICKECQREQDADDNDDWINWRD